MPYPRTTSDTADANKAHVATCLNRVPSSLGLEHRAGAGDFRVVCEQRRPVRDSKHKGEGNDDC